MATGCDVARSALISMRVPNRGRSFSILRAQYPMAEAPATDLRRTPCRLVLLPGMDGTRLLFRPLLAALPEWIGAEVVRYPVRGPNRYEDLLPLVADRVARGGPCIVLGWSFSGPLALRVACLQPQCVRGVILAASFVSPPSMALARLRLLVRGPTFSAVRLLRRLPIWLLRPRTDRLRRDKAVLWRRVPARTLAVRARDVLAVDARDALSRCPCPLLYIAADSDAVVPLRNATAILRARPDVAVETIRGGHLALYTDPAASSRSIASFVKRCAERTAHTTTALRPPSGAP